MADYIRGNVSRPDGQEDGRHVFGHLENGSLRGVVRVFDTKCERKAATLRCGIKAPDHPGGQDRYRSLYVPDLIAMNGCCQKGEDKEP